MRSSASLRPVLLPPLLATNAEVALVGECEEGMGWASWSLTWINIMARCLLESGNIGYINDDKSNKTFRSGSQYLSHNHVSLVRVADDEGQGPGFVSLEVVLL